MEFTVASLFVLSSLENLYIAHHNLDLLCDIYNAMTEHNRGETHYLSSTVNYFDICL